MDDQFLNDMNDLANRIQSHADSEDGRRIAQIAQHIINHDWESAIALIEMWSLSEQPEELTEGIDGRELLNAIREAFE